MVCEILQPPKIWKANNHVLGDPVVDIHISKAVLRQAPWLNAGTIG